MEGAAQHKPLLRCYVRERVISDANSLNLTTRSNLLTAFVILFSVSDSISAFRQARILSKPSAWFKHKPGSAHRQPKQSANETCESVTDFRVFSSGLYRYETVKTFLFKGILQISLQALMNWRIYWKSCLCVSQFP